MTTRNRIVSEDSNPFGEEAVSQVRYRGPLEDGHWPDTLEARVVTPGNEPRVHGYDVERDLAKYYGWTDLLFLALSGELPSPAASAALNVAAVFLAPASTAHASTHASVLAQLCGASTSSTVAVAAIAQSERSRRLLDEQAPLLKWCAEPDRAFPSQSRSFNEVDQSSVERLRDALDVTGLSVAGLDESPSRSAALVLVLYACGLRTRQQLEAAITQFCLPSAIAEAFGQKITEFSTYPINLPLFVLEE